VKLLDYWLFILGTDSLLLVAVIVSWANFGKWEVAMVMIVTTCHAKDM